MDSSAYTYRPALFERLGLTVPRSFEALCELLQRWQDELQDEHPDMQPLMLGQPRRHMMTQAIELTFLAQQVRGDSLRFDDPLLRDLLSRALALDLPDLTWADNDYGFMNKLPLISYTNLSLGSLSSSAGWGPDEQVLPLLLKPSETLPAILPLQLSYLGIYAASDAPDRALRYLEAAIPALDYETRVKLYPDFNEPLQLPGMEGILARFDSQIAALEQQIKSAQGAEKTELERQLEDKRLARAQQASMRWHLSPDIIASYRDMMAQALILTRESHTIIEQPDFRQLIDRLHEGQIDLDAFIEEAQGKLRLMQLEAQ